MKDPYIEKQEHTSSLWNHMENVFDKAVRDERMGKDPIDIVEAFDQIDFIVAAFKGSLDYNEQYNLLIELAAKAIGSIRVIPDPEDDLDD